MIALSSDNSVFFDVDETLILWNPTADQIAREGIPYKQGDITFYYVPHKIHVQNLINHKTRGHFVAVWSAGGCAWAETAVKILGIERYVDLVIAKPKWCYDDLPPEQYMPKSQWKEDK